MSNCYILNGIESETLLVIRAKDKKIMLSLIDYLASSRKEEIKELAYQLEKSLNDNTSRRNTVQARPKNKAKSPASNRSGRKKTTNPKRRAQPRS